MKNIIRGDTSKKWLFWVAHTNWGGGGPRPDHNSGSKNYHVLFLLLFDPEALKTCKNKIKLLNLHVLPYPGMFKDRLSSLLSAQTHGVISGKIVPNKKL